MKRRAKIEWPKGPVTWIVSRTLYVSVPFTWNLPEVRTLVSQRDWRWDQAVVGGPAIDLMPDYLTDLPGVKVGGESPGVLQRHNPLATRTTTGCTRHCPFCGIGQGLIESGGLTELHDWPDLPIVCDNNFLAASLPHFDRVIDRLAGWGWADFNQGLDARLLTEYHARRLAEIRRPMVRLALDRQADGDTWNAAVDLLLAAGVAKANIRTFCLIGFRDTPSDAWARCRWIEARGVKALPMWFHPLDALERNTLTPEQRAFGWTDGHRKAIMQWHYQHRTSQGRYRHYVENAPC